MPYRLTLEPRWRRSLEFGAGPVSPLTIALGILVGVLQLVNQLVLNTPSDYQARTAIATALALAATFLIQPLFGPSLQTALHMTKQQLLISGGILTAATTVLSIVALPTGLHAAFATVLTLAGALIFGSPLPVVSTPAVPDVSPVPPGI